MHRVRMPEAGAGWLCHAVHRAKTAKARNEFVAAIQDLRRRSENASKLKDTYTSISGPLSSEQINRAATDDETHFAACGPVPVGMEAPRDELLGLIQQQQQQLKVITIVGFHGIGKSLLAKHVYSTTESQYEARAWVCATEVGGKAADVLKEILRQLGHQPTSGRLGELQARIKECISTKRFFIVIDDMRTTAYWHQMKEAFAGLSGRFLVTTAIQSVARSSSARDHVYAMKTLADEDSRTLFIKEAFQDDDPPPDAEELGSEALKKCDGLPLALVTTARFLKSSGDLTPREWARLCADLGSHLEKEEMFARMRHVLLHSYNSLDSQDVRRFLLYLGTYPSGSPIRKSRLIRRWLAEGISPGISPGEAISNFSKLVDQSIIQPIDSTTAEAKTFHTHGMMMEFVMRKSMSDKFITCLLYNQLSPQSLSAKIRRLSLHDASVREVGDLSLVRSVIIFGNAHPSVLDFSKYQLLRVLDLEECQESLGDSHVTLICRNLLLLRYLCLRPAVMAKQLPKQIKKLQFLETLDVRRTQIEILPTQVVTLPCLLHIFGKFKLRQGVGGCRMRKLQAWLRENSKLKTLAGFFVDSNNSMGFAQLMDHMNHLTKVKIWCESTADGGSSSSNLSDLSNAVKGFIERSIDREGSPSLSLNFNDKVSQHLLMNLSIQKEKDYSYYLGSLKLQGSNICSLPPFVTMLDRLTKLCLSSPQHQLSLSQDVLAALSNLYGLECLKLIAAQLDKLVIAKGELRSLLRLSIVAESMTGLEIQEGALPWLKSLGLLCKDLAVFSSMLATKSLGRLEEIALHQEVCDKTNSEWIQAAKNHPRRPKILFLKTKMKEPSVQRSQ